MTTLHIHGNLGSCPVYIGERSQSLESLLKGRSTILVTDTTVQGLHAGRFPHLPILAIGTGEGIKCLSTVEQLYRQLSDLQADRSTVLVGVGGGIVCDLTGFVAATYLRGVPFAFVPTTLLAQVDAAIGGKNGVNLDGYKNLIGTFRQPEFILCDPSFLETLPADELRNGFAEIIKAAAIADGSLFGLIAERHSEIQRCDAELLQNVMTAAVAVKVSIVNRDETEQSERRLLNFGHTLGHALERVFGIRHGEAVAIGMIIAADLSVRRGLLAKEECELLRKVIAKYGFPTDLPVGSRDRLVDAMGKDKKRAGRKIHMILLKSLGHAADVELDMHDLGSLLP